MLRQKKWIAVVLCSLALLMAFSVSTGSAHAASSTSHARLNSSAQIKPLLHSPNSVAPPGCNVYVSLSVQQTNTINYAGHQLIVVEQLYGWYTQLNNGALAYCNAISCWASVAAVNNSTYPPGNLSVECNTNPKKTVWVGGGSGNSSIGDHSNPPTSTEVCAFYQPAGGSVYHVGWGCLAGDNVYVIPRLIV